jgi:hypothetical protein
MLGAGHLLIVNNSSICPLDGNVSSADISTQDLQRGKDHDVIAP